MLCHLKYTPFSFSAYRSRMHVLPPQEALRTVAPFMNERMRKRRCFADKNLEVVMMERERQLELAKSRAPVISQPQLAVLPPNLSSSSAACGGVANGAASKSRPLLGSLTPREFLQKIFPTHNSNLLELVWQGCGGNLERAIEQLASGVKGNNCASLPGAGQAISSHHATVPHPFQTHSPHVTAPRLHAAMSNGLLGVFCGFPLAALFGIRSPSHQDAARISHHQNVPLHLPAQHPVTCSSGFPFVSTNIRAGPPVLTNASLFSQPVAGSAALNIFNANGIAQELSVRGSGALKRFRPWFRECKKVVRKSTDNSLPCGKSAFRSCLPREALLDASNRPLASDQRSVSGDSSRGSRSPSPNCRHSPNSADCSGDDGIDSEVPRTVGGSKSALKFSVDSIIGNV